jgi:membrane-associated phospholipid phosphatase
MSKMRSIVFAFVGFAWFALPATASSATLSVSPEGAETQPAERKRFWPSRQAWRDAALGALRDPGTWVPAGMAGVVAIGGWDQEISDWAVSNTPVFGSVENAATWTEILHAADGVGMIATALSVDTDQDPWPLRGNTLGVEAAAAFTTISLTEGIKYATGRERPDGSNNMSFPSGHASLTFAYAAACRRNLQAIELDRGWRIGLTVGFETLAVGTAWARVEADKHYPTDVLVGAALGNYVALFLHDAFLGSSANVSVSLNVDPHRPSMAVSMSF